jgi:hypothetical protein
LPDQSIWLIAGYAGGEEMTRIKLTDYADITGWPSSGYILNVGKISYGPFPTTEEAERVWKSMGEAPRHSWEIGGPANTP